MTFHLELLRSLKDPNTKFSQLKTAEVIPVPYGKIALIVFLSVLVSIVQAYYGLHTAGLSHLLGDYQRDQFELAKAFTELGAILNAIASPISYLLFTSVCVWLLIDDVSYRQALVISTVSTFILIIGHASLVPFQIWLGVDSVTSPFALGVLAHLFLANEYVLYFFGQLSVFLLVTVLLQIYALTILSTMKKSTMIIVVASIHLLVILFTVFLQILSNLFIAFN